MTFLSRTAATKSGLSFFVLFVQICATAVCACAQTLPALQVNQPTLPTDGVLTLTLDAPPPSLPKQSTWRVAVYEHGSFRRLAEAKKRFTQVGETWSTTLRLDAIPGRYDLRVIANDKDRTAISEITTVTVPGIVREPGWWLFDGSPFVEIPKKSDVPQPSDAPFFVTGLRRDGKKFDRKIIRSQVALRWRVFKLPSLRELVENKNYDYEALEFALRGQLREAFERGERNYLGFAVEAEDEGVSWTDARSVITRLRQLIQSIQPEAALIFVARQGRATSKNQTGDEELNLTSALQNGADLSDAIAIAPGVRSARAPSWDIKVARRIVEEQENYDLPLFLISPWQQDDSAITQATEFWMAGASGGVLLSTENALTELSSLLSRNANLFIGSVTLEDTGILPLDRGSSSNSASMGMAEGTRALYDDLRKLHRVPGLALLKAKTEKKLYESFMAILGESIDANTIAEITSAARSGARIYLEGTPTVADADHELWSTLVGATTKPVKTQATTLICDDPWMFGTLVGSKIPVTKSVEVTLKTPLPTSASSAKSKDKSEKEKGLDVLMEPRVLAKLEDGTPALVENPLGDGTVFWAPQRIRNTQNQTKAQYYAAIAAQQGTGLVRVRAGTSDSASMIRVAVRRSPKGTWLIGLFNSTAAATSATLEVNHYAEVALDLKQEKEIPLTSRGNRVTLETVVPANGWQIIALGTTRKELDEERFAPRAKIKLK